MNSDIIIIMQKEFSRFFKDRRLVIFTLLLPGILIYAVYSFMGTAMQSVFAPDDRTAVIHAVNLPDSLLSREFFAEAGIVHIGFGEIGRIIEEISKKEVDILLVFPVNFDEMVARYDVQIAEASAPNIEVYYNSVDPNSLDTYNRIVAELYAYESSLANKFDINRDINNADTASAEDVTARIISSMMPMVLMIFLYTACVGLAPESIAGEKERGTIATLLVTPLKRSQLAAGKILSLAVLSFLSGCVTAVATVLSLPNLMGSGAEDIISVVIYGPKDYLLLALVILSTILLFITLISLISAFSKTVKEAGTAVMPLMVLVMLVGVSGMFGDAQSDPILYMVPMYGSVQSMSGIFALDYSVANVVISCISNLTYACAGGYALTKMFNSERVMFSK